MYKIEYIEDNQVVTLDNNGQGFAIIDANALADRIRNEQQTETKIIQLD